jgi:hypothetical protein
MAKLNEDRQRRGGRPKNEGRELAKSDHYKLSDRARFALRWLMAHESARDRTALIEELVEGRADDVCKQRNIAPHWLTLFSPHNEGISTLRLFALPNYRPSSAERAQHHFVMQHAPFFYDDDQQTQPSVQRVTILWPRIKEYQKLWQAKRDTDGMWIAAKAMAAELKKNGEPVPKGGGRW